MSAIGCGRHEERRGLRDARRDEWPGSSSHCRPCPARRCVRSQEGRALPAGDRGVGAGWAASISSLRVRRRSLGVHVICGASRRAGRARPAARAVDGPENPQAGGACQAGSGGGRRLAGAGSYRNGRAGSGPVAHQTPARRAPRPVSLRAAQGANRVVPIRCLDPRCDWPPVAGLLVLMASARLPAALRIAPARSAKWPETHRGRKKN